jgi:hypothetical protein
MSVEDRIRNFKKRAREDSIAPTSEASSKKAKVIDDAPISSSSNSKQGASSNKTHLTEKIAAALQNVKQVAKQPAKQAKQTKAAHSSSAISSVANPARSSKFFQKPPPIFNTLSTGARASALLKTLPTSTNEKKVVQATASRSTSKGDIKSGDNNSTKLKSLAFGESGKQQEKRGPFRNVSSDWC